MLSVFLGAGFSRVGGVPMASQLFDMQPQVDRITRQRLVERVTAHWEEWKIKTGGEPEQYLAHLEQFGGKAWTDAQWYVGLRIALATSRVEFVGSIPTVTRHNLDRTSGVTAHELFWSAIFKKREDVGVITTNYDVLPERGLRHKPRPRINRPGFHYGNGHDELEGGGYPSYSHIQKIAVEGRIPLLKLHGSVSWSFRDGRLVRYHDCRPAIRGDAAIVAPVIAKMLPKLFEPIWNAADNLLRSSDTWVVVGYSLPEYDHLVRDLFKRAFHKEVKLHIFDPNPAIGQKFRDLLSEARIQQHGGLPDSLDELEGAIS